MTQPAYDHGEMFPLVQGADIQESMPDFYSCIGVDAAATYRVVPLSPDESYVVGGHYGGLSHNVEGGAAEIIQAIGQGVGDPRHSQHALFISQSYPPRAVVYERIDL